ncbi:hypothetical protein CMI42_02310 [Candidatus Pacearchaeota archaeon]|nr:hypothetical protein [Candidatus Pacearchaeota archaeon]
MKKKEKRKFINVFGGKNNLNRAPPTAFNLSFRKRNVSERKEGKKLVMGGVLIEINLRFYRNIY